MPETLRIVIPTYNRNSHLSNLLADLEEQIVKDFEVIVVDASEKHSAKKILKQRKKIDIHYLSVNSDKYWTGSVNAGIKYVLGKRNNLNITGILLLNDDIRINDDYIKNLFHLNKKYSKHLIGSVNVSNNDRNTISWAGMKTNKWTSYTKYFFKGRNIDNINSNKVIESFTLIGRGLFIPINVFDQVDLFDEENIKHRGDTEFPLRAKKAGYNLLVSFNLIVYCFDNMTYSLDHGSLRLKDFKKVFFDFRSSSYWKTRYYYAKSATSNKLQRFCFYTLNMLIHLRRFLIRVFQ
ncbi:MAG: glycosyltransferase family 2 protein [Bacteroidota bacterium]